MLRSQTVLGRHARNPFLMCGGHRDESEGYCFADRFPVYFGIESSNEFNAAVDQVCLPPKVLGLVSFGMKVWDEKDILLYSLYTSEFRFDALDPAWDIALDWIPPETDCPAGFDELVSTIQFSLVS